MTIFGISIIFFIGSCHSHHQSFLLSIDLNANKKILMKISRVAIMRLWRICISSVYDYFENTAYKIKQQPIVHNTGAFESIISTKYKMSSWIQRSINISHFRAYFSNNRRYFNAKSSHFAYAVHSSVKFIQNWNCRST